ncbi:MAG: hypothetical protein KIT73_07450 [Burkholderiales bacterium]|nr:hypothetical protein [Burkholderiales bacterium]
MNDTALIAWLDSAHLPGDVIINLAAAALVTALVHFAMTLALPVQDILGDPFASLSIAGDKPSRSVTSSSSARRAWCGTSG